jgi:hypothetical protein
MSDHSLLLEISNCSELRRATNSSHPCHRIVNCQAGSEEFQLPEPWTGHLSSAPILFISSNPSINEEEAYPTTLWNNNVVTDFFEYRFDVNRPWTKNGRYVLLKDRRTYNTHWVRFWASVRKRAEELLGRAASPGQDYAITEVVHCKSRAETGVSEALSTCSEKWLEPILENSAANIVVLLGNRARDVCCKLWEINWERTVHFNVIAGNRPRAIVILPHPNAFKPKKITDYANAEEIKELRILLPS